MDNHNIRPDQLLSIQSGYTGLAKQLPMGTHIQPGTCCKSFFLPLEQTHRVHMSLGMLLHLRNKSLLGKSYTNFGQFHFGNIHLGKAVGQYSNLHQLR